MPREKYKKKLDIMNEIISRQKEIVGNDMISRGLLDCLIPLSGSDGKITSIDENGNVTIEFSAPIQSYLELLTKNDLLMILGLLDDEKK